MKTHINDGSNEWISQTFINPDTIDQLFSVCMGMSNIWYNYFKKIILFRWLVERQWMIYMGALIAPTQLGGVKGGAEPAVHKASRYLEKMVS